MSKRGGRITSGDRLTARLLRWSPFLAFLVLALPLPAFFLLRYFTAAGNDAAEYMVLALTSLGLFSVFGLVAAFLVVLYRRFWERRLRERLASDGVTADELPHFASELTAEHRRALREMEAQNPLLADAYRETLAARLTATRVLARARDDAATVERRLQSVSNLQATGRAELEQDLQKDRARLERVEREADEHARELDARLQLIEAIASRDASQAETELALKRLGSVRENLPLTLQGVRDEQHAREEIEQELRQLTTPPPEERPGT
ncbi:MAG TPA: hypothetical protein VJ866_14230 [Pyrinomonadaceae bacterium]|nr:hypothetical protein [Pyrinomonadaceae bacterium]